MIEILNYKAIGKGIVVASFSIRLKKWADFEIRELALFSKDSKRWIGFPSRPYEVDGKKKYYAYVGFKDPDVQRKMCDEILKAIDALVGKQPVQDELPF